jgi:hypothetical protein
MRHRRLSWLAVAAAVAVTSATAGSGAPATVPTADAARKPAKPCTRRGAGIAADSRRGRLLVSRDRTTWYGCVRPRGKIRKLRTIEPDCFHTCETISDPKVAGAYGAFVYHYDFSYGGGADTESLASVQLFNLRTGKQAGLHAAPVSSQPQPDGSTSRRSSVSAYALASDGTVVALVAEGSTLVLRLHALGGQATELDRGNIDPASVRITGGQAVWLKDGAPRSATLP